MSGPVDVLTVLRRVSRHVPNEDFVEFDDALHAVVELVEAVGVFRTHYSTEGCAFPDCNLCKRSRAAEERLDAALARAGGA